MKFNHQLPNYFHIGMQKSGSTFFHNLLRQHPKICLGKISEIHFYTKNFEKGFDWYRSKFEPCNAKILVDISPKFFMSPAEAAPRIKQYVENPKFTLILRNPVNYVYSHYKMHYNQGFFLREHKKKFKKNPSFDELVNIFPEYLERGNFHKLFKQWILYFDILKFKVIIFEEFVKNPQIYMNEVFDFFQVDRININDVMETSKNMALRNPFFYKIKRFIIKREKFKNHFKNSQILDKMFNFFLAKTTQIPDFQKKFLQDYYREDTQKLSQLLAIDFGKWQDLNNT